MNLRDIQKQAFETAAEKRRRTEIAYFGLRDALAAVKEER